MADKNPKLFISYSWSNPEHEKWVIELSTQLRESGVDVILDKWNLKEGQDALVFMEQMVTNPEIHKVAIICDKTYAEKADGRSGGVGTETQIISPKIYAKTDQTKFVVVVCETNENGRPCLPAYYKSRIYIDLSESESYSSNFEQLLRWIYDKPLYIKPELGKTPAFLSEDNPISLGTTTLFRRAIDAIKSNKESAKGALDDYFSAFQENLENFRIADKEEGEFDEIIIDNINKFTPYRNEAIEVFLCIAKYRNQPETIQQVHRFFEQLIPYLYKPNDVQSWKEWDFDNYIFIIHELFLYAIASLLKCECFESISQLLGSNYYVERNADYGRNVMVSFPVFRQHPRSFAYRNDRLKLRRLSLHADLLINRTNNVVVSDKLLLQTDFILFIRDCLYSLKNTTRQDWWPVTLVYASRLSAPIEIFARALSTRYFESVKKIFDIQKKEDFGVIFDAFKQGKLTIPRWEFDSFDPVALMGYDKLATRP
jgi:hypothetical protein